MKRTALALAGLALFGAGAANAQLTMQMNNGWNFTFSGNVNAFLTFEDQKLGDTPTSTPGGIVGGEFTETRIRTGLLPAFAVFNAKGKEGNTDLGVQFGFAPQINCGDAINDCFGAQIDMRQVFLTVGGEWGQILAGRELGLFQRQNILTDQTLFGIGATGSANSSGSGGDVGTTLGRIGFGYIYPNFRAQMTYSTPAGRPAQFSVGLFEATAVGDYNQNELPRVEAEFTYDKSGAKFWLSGMAQSVKDLADESAAQFGIAGGIRYATGQFSITGSGYAGKGIGTTLIGNLGSADTGAGSDDMRTSYGYIAQLTFTPSGSKVTLAGSYGASTLKAAEDVEGEGKTTNSLISGGIYYQATKSLKVVGEINYAQTTDDIDATDANKSIAPAVGLMLFF